MPPFLERVLRIVGYPERLARRRLLPALLLAMVLAGLVVAGSAAGLYAYAVYQWRAAEVALSQEQPAEARARLGFCLAIWPRSPDVHLRAGRLTGRGYRGGVPPESVLAASERGD